MYYWKTLDLANLMDLSKIYLLHQDNSRFQSGLGDTEEISLEVDSVRG